MTTRTTEPNQIERPTRVEKGQRWQWPSMRPLTVAKVIVKCEEHMGRECAHYETGSQDATRSLLDPAGDAVFLGWATGYAPTPTGPSGEGRLRPAKGQRWRDVQTGTVYTLDRRYDHDESLGWCHEPGSSMYWPDHCFTNGRLEYVDSPPSPQIEAASAPKATPVAAKRREVPASCLMERWNETGPLSALEAIQAKKPPEPWRPGCDELFWIPDAY